MFTLRHGWTDFFAPFCEEDNQPYNRLFNQRAYRFEQGFQRRPQDSTYTVLKERLYRFGLKQAARLVKARHSISYFTQDLWYQQRATDFISSVFNIPALGIHNLDIVESSRIIIRNLWVYSPETAENIEKIRSVVNIEGPYVSMHIRAGDKFLEAELKGAEEYMQKAVKYGVKKAFVLTDDYRVMEILNKHYTDWEFFTLCGKEERGYFHNQFSQLTPEEKYHQHLRLFASMDICAEGIRFIGTYSSNPGMYMGLRMGQEFCDCLDSETWKFH